MLAMLLAASLAAPVPKAKAEFYFPIQEGAKMVMEWESGGQKHECVHTVTRVEANKGTYAVTVESQAFGSVTTHEQRVSDEGVAVLSGEAWVTQFRPTAGVTWSEDVPLTGKFTYTVGKEEEVKVPAGTFAAFPVVCVATAPGGRESKSTTWYAKGVGPVKVEMHRQEPMVLKEFTTGK